MSADLRRLVSLAWEKRRSGSFWIVFVLSAVLLVSWITESLVLRHDTENFPEVINRRCADYLATAANEFGGMQRIARRTATELAQSPTVLDYLANRDTSRADLFDAVIRIAQSQDVGVEVYDREARLAAWDGHSGPPHRREVRIALDGQMISYVNRTPIASQLFVAIPVREEGAILGAVLVRQTIDVSYPLNNRFIRREGLSDQLTRRLGVNIEFNFSPNAEPKKDGRYLSSILYGIDSSAVGVVSVMKPPRTAFLEGRAASFQAFNSVVLALLLGFGALCVWRILSGPRVPALASVVGVTALIWLARYAMLWIDIPSSIISSGVFDPAYFASKFGGGMAKSIGEMTISAIATILTILYAGRVLLNASRQPAARYYPSSVVLRVLLASIISLLLFWTLRGYGALIRSVVFDSTLKYSDPRMILPSFELGVMVLDLFIVGFCLVAVAVASGWIMMELLSGPGDWGRRSWTMLALLFIASAALFQALQETPLMSLGYRLFFAGVVIALLVLLHYGRTHSRPAAGVRLVLIPLAISAVMYFPLLENSVREKDRKRVEAFAEEMLKPVDGWFKFVVDDGLQRFETEDTADILSRSEAEDAGRLAFTRWAQSIACREGYTSLFSVYDSLGREVSRFAIGGQSSVTARVETTLSALPHGTRLVKDFGSGINALKVYAGSAAIREYDSSIVGYARVIIVAGQQALFRGENPAILRSASSETPQMFYRPVTISEYLDGLLVTTTNQNLPIHYRLPSQVRDSLRSSSAASLWMDQDVGGTVLESYFIRDNVGEDADIVSLEMPKPGLGWYLIGIVRVILYYTVISIAVLAGYTLVLIARGGKYRFTFRDRLLVAFVLTAVVPLALIALYGRITAGDRLMTRTGQRLGSETASVIANMPDSVLADPVLANPAIAEQVAAEVGTDFNMYAGGDLTATSRPELFEAGILDRRISGSAYASVVLEGDRFLLEKESIGLYQYAVGYRPILNDDGAIVGVVSVPTLFRQDELDAELSSRNAFLFGIYFVVFLSMLAIATTFASRIAAPVHRLTEATRRVSRGDFKVDLDDIRAEGEIGELISSFSAMTKDLQSSREELVRFERELAWKEMAKQVAHEIKNPLTPMKLAIQHLRMTYRDRVEDFDQVLQDVTRTIIEQIDTLSRIASEFSHFARMPKGKLEPCDVREVLTETRHLFDRQESVEFEMDLADVLSPVLADREELRRAFINIVRNALQAMDNKGGIRMTAAMAGEEVHVTIADTGPGIPEDVKAKLFQPNFSTKTEGMGLGLAIVKKTVDDLGGSIEISSVPGSGTTVSILLPGLAQNPAGGAA
jgi:two-component system, NtrC family, nitrogen regulation sensor histidine kinase NtrY